MTRIGDVGPLHASLLRRNLEPPVTIFNERGADLPILGEAHHERGLPYRQLIGALAVRPVVRVGDTSLDYIEADGEITSQHYAFLVSEIEFDEIFERIRERRLSYWADPGATSATRSTAGTMGAGSTSTTRTATCWRSSPVRTAAVLRRRPDLILWSRGH